jgi:thiol-disulfide isomerase/thioredoxin
MIGSTYLFMDKQDEALPAYDKVIKNYEDSYKYKAMFKSAGILSDYGRSNEAVSLYNRIEFECKIQSLVKKTQKKSMLAVLLGSFAMNLDVSEWLGEEPIDVDQSFGKVVFIVFWSTWCPSCQKEIPHLNKLYEEFSATDLVMLSVTKNNRGQTTEKVKSFIKDKGIRFPVGIDIGGKSSKNYRASSIPAGVLIDKNGIIRWQDNPATLRKSFLKTLLEET